MDRLTKWIPAETLAIYLPAVTWLSTGGNSQSVGLLIGMIAATPLFVVAAAYSTGKVWTRAIWKRVLASAAIATIAFAIWSMSVPLSGWGAWKLHAAYPGGFAVGAAVVALIFGLFAEGFMARLSKAP